MDIKNVRKWCREFNEGRINVHDEQRSGRPSLPESTVARIDEMVRANRRITIEEIEDGLNEDCSHFSVHKIVSETLGYRKVSARWVDKWLKEAGECWPGRVCSVERRSAAVQPTSRCRPDWTCTVWSWTLLKSDVNDARESSDGGALTARRILLSHNKFLLNHSYSRRIPTTSTLFNQLSKIKNIRNAHFGNNKKNNIRWPTVFFFGFSGMSFVTAMVLEKEYPREKYCDVMRVNVPRPAVGGDLLERWNALSDNERAIGVIVGINVLIMTLWRLPFAGSVMGPLFSLKEIPRGFPMLFSLFSHTNPVHLAINAGILWSCGVPLMDCIGLEQTLSIYLSGGIFASLVGTIFKYHIKSSAISMGATGASLAVMAAYCTFFPDQKLTFLLPNCSYDADTVKKALVIIETIGVLLAKNYTLDHAGNLGGLLFGWLYARFGHELIWLKRDKIQDLWEVVRGYLSDTIPHFKKDGKK
ncbi:PARL [Cordylochernes scorpioides]|uniref:rhomboid protease n=1 Tax=Cordylochernes scorpioides TaxID=51811 RepID=A0ABY6LH18_9ARAC|nr:PARL [Cordylochernes scorpioides]